jgi:hypothetical protein
MNAIRIRQQVTSRVVEIPELDPFIGKSVEIIVLEDSEPPKPKQISKAGSAKGQIWMSDDFDAPLDDFADYM